jgi:hypothetical protein
VRAAEEGQCRVMEHHLLGSRLGWWAPEVGLLHWVDPGLAWSVRQEEGVVLGEGVGAQRAQQGPSAHLLAQVRLQASSSSRLVPLSH